MMWQETSLLSLRLYFVTCLHVERIVTKIGYPLPRLLFEPVTSLIPSSAHLTSTFSNIISVLCSMDGRLEARTENKIKSRELDNIDTSSPVREI
jgi:hypothetical protein